MRSFLPPLQETQEDLESYQDASKRLRSLIPEPILEEKLSQYECELEEDFLGFLEPYDAVSRFLPKEFAVVDFGCYMAPQAFYFQSHRRYIGVDAYDLAASPRLLRFETPNSLMVSGTIQETVGWFSPSVYAICSAVPDKKAVDLVRQRFPNHCITYPLRKEDISGVQAEKIRSFLQRNEQTHRR